MEMSGWYKAGYDAYWMDSTGHGKPVTRRALDEYSAGWMAAYAEDVSKLGDMMREEGR
jgi:hypothetical protein